MKFKKLELSGFKSFFDNTTLFIEDGLTGIVGPNGCGKSNIVEALRWCMGETSPKSMRGSGMEDVIFSGTANKTSKNIAEVNLTLDNSDKDGPFQFKELDMVNVKEEAGDILWYLAVLFDEIGTDFESEMKRVIKKLQKRFPDKFTESGAYERDIKSEREILEK